MKLPMNADKKRKPQTTMENIHKTSLIAGRTTWKSGFVMVLDSIASDFFDCIGVYRRSSAADNRG